MKSLEVLSAVCLIGIAFPAAAQDDRVESSLVDGLATCLTITDDARRLACTDTAARRLVDAVRKREVVVVDEAQVRSTKRSLFGFTLPRRGLFGSDGPDKAREEIEAIDAKITRVTTIGSGRYAITIEGGARWNTTEAWTGYPLPEDGAVASIKKGTLGGYFIKVGRSKAIRAIRVG